MISNLPTPRYSKSCNLQKNQSQMNRLRFPTQRWAEFDTFATDEDSTDNTLTQVMEEWEEKQVEDVIETCDYSYLLDDEVSK